VQIDELFPGLKRTPIDALFAADNANPNPNWNPRRDLKDAEVIIGVDVMSQRPFLVYGRDTVERVAAGGRAKKVRALAVELDQETEELERLCALVQVLKGRHDYQ